MSRLADRFARLSQSGEKALVCYTVAGDPSLDRTVDIVRALDSASVDAIELGVPFSDPMADGPSIQDAAFRALERGASVPGVFELVRTIRSFSEIPIVLMTYYNPALRYGIERFARDAAKSGADEVIQTDLTPEEAQPWIEAARANNLDTVFLLAPTSTADRIEIVSRIGTGFIYCVSRTGVTGAREDVPQELSHFVGQIKQKTPLPICVGFGVSKPEQVRQIGEFADGAVVGSALVNVIEQAGNSDTLESSVRTFAAGLKAATR